MLKVNIFAVETRSTINVAYGNILKYRLEFLLQANRGGNRFESYVSLPRDYTQNVQIQIKLDIAYFSRWNVQWPVVWSDSARVQSHMELHYLTYCLPNTLKYLLSKTMRRADDSMFD